MRAEGPLPTTMVSTWAGKRRAGILQSHKDKDNDRIIAMQREGEGEGEGEGHDECEENEGFNKVGSGCHKMGVWMYEVGIFGIVIKRGLIL